MPWAASSSWSLYRARVSALLEGADVRVCVAFWLFGLINNVLYVIILSAALDLVGPTIPKSAVLLFDVVPSFIVKLTAPYYIHRIPYSLRVLVFVGLSTCGMLLIALTPSSVGQNGPPSPERSEILVKMSGVVLASLSSGGGELSFLGLTHYYGNLSLAAWGSGTGGAGLIGAGAYVLATTTLALTVRTSLLVFSFLPVVMLLSFFVVLPKARMQRHASYQSIPDADDLTSNGHRDDPLSRVEDDEDLSTAQDSLKHQGRPDAWHTFMTNLSRARGLFFPYMLPLLLVYVAEYTINQGVAPTLLFPLDETPFDHYRAFYPTYNALYQLGVFISRSSLPFVRIQSLYTPTLLQCLNLGLLTAHALNPFIPNVYFIFVVTFWEGLLGGLVYVSTFRRIREEVKEEDREFSLGATTVSDSGGICIAGFVGMALETGLCNRQVAQGRDWCRKL
ncbi:hypothetical protein MBLNU459_g3447t2 [Dothideomycetes sp. NU459]